MLSREHCPPLAMVGVQTPAAQYSAPVLQSPSTVQLPSQSVPAQLPVGQVRVCTAGQLPAPSQVAERVAVPLVQSAARHSTLPPGYAHAARCTPLQVPPQAEPSSAHDGRVPTGAPVTSVQVPSDPETLHASHCPLQGALQQKPSTQNPLAHSVLPVQVSPFVLAGTHAPASQRKPVWHCVSVVQVVRQTVALQRYGSQLACCCAGQEPEPLQNASSTD